VDSLSPEAAALRVQLTSGASDAQLRLDVEASHSSLTGPQPDWREASAQLRYQAASGAALAGRVEYARRFGINDVYVEAAAEQRLSYRARAYVSVGTTIDPDFRPRWQIGAGGSLRVRDGANATVLTLDARQASFASGDVQSVTSSMNAAPIVPALSCAGICKSWSRCGSSPATAMHRTRTKGGWCRYGVSLLASTST
jgi:hypothetical protein